MHCEMGFISRVKTLRTKCVEVVFAMPKPPENWCVLGPRIMLSKTVLGDDISKLWSGSAENLFLGRP